MGSIIVAIDFSSMTELLLNTADEEAKAFQDDIYFIHVAESDPDFVGFDAGPLVPAARGSGRTAGGRGRVSLTPGVPGSAKNDHREGKSNGH